MTNCPCCSDLLLRQIHHHEIHWFCRTCWQEMPVMSEKNYSLVSQGVIETLSTKLQKLENRAAKAYAASEQIRLA